MALKTIEKAKVKYLDGKRGVRVGDVKTTREKCINNANTDDEFASELEFIAQTGKPSARAVRTMLRNDCAVRNGERSSASQSS